MTDTGNRGECILPLPVAELAVPPVTHVRSTLLRSSFDAIQGLGLRDAYLGRLAPEYHSAVQELVIGQWLPVEIALAHYGAIESLRLTDAQAFANGRLVADRIQNSYVGTLTKMLGTTATLWSGLPRLPGVWARTMQGGATSLYRLGPKDARVEVHGIPLARYAYFRQGLAGMFTSSLELVTRKVHCRAVAVSPMRVDFLISWV